MTVVCGLPEIFLASWSGNAKKVKELIFSGVDANLETKKGWTPLMAAARNGHLEVAKILIKYGADIHQRNFNQDTPLIWATHSSAKVVRLLLKKGVDINATNVNEYSAIAAAVKIDNLETVKELLRWNPDLSLRTVDEESVLHLAVEHASLAVVEALLENNAEISPKNIYGNTPLIIAAKHNKVNEVRLLLSYGASVNETNFGNNTSLHWAAANGSIEIVQELISKGADINVENSRGWSPFSLALEAKHYDLCKFLMDEGAYLGKNVYGYTALHLAAAVGSVDILREVLATGAKVKAKDWRKKTPLDYATMVGNHDTAKELLLHTPGISDSLEQPTLTVKDKSIKALNSVRSSYFKAGEVLANSMGPLFSIITSVFKCNCLGQCR